MGAHSFATWFVMAEAVVSALPHHTSCRGVYAASRGIRVSQLSKLSCHCLTLTNESLYATVVVVMACGWLRKLFR